MFSPEKSWLLADWLRGSFQEKKGPGLPCADEDPCTWAPGVALSFLCSVRYLFSSYIWGLFYSLWRHVLCILCVFSYLIPTALSQFYIWRNGNIDELSNLLKVTQSFSNKPRIKPKVVSHRNLGLWHWQPACHYLWLRWLHAGRLEYVLIRLIISWFTKKVVKRI